MDHRGRDRHKYSVKIGISDVENSFNHRKSHIYDRIDEKMKKSTNNDFMAFCFTAKKDFIPDAEIRQIPKIEANNRIETHLGRIGISITFFIMLLLVIVIEKYIITIVEIKGTNEMEKSEKIRKNPI